MSQLPTGGYTFGAIRELAGYIIDNSDLESLADLGGTLSPSEIETLLKSLPKLTERTISSLGHHDSVCPVCLVPFLALLAEEETALAMDSPAHPVENLGVTRLAESWQCGHVFCRRDISQWIKDGHDSCPTCRRPLLQPNQNDPNPRGQTQSTPVGISEPVAIEQLLRSFPWAENQTQSNRSQPGSVPRRESPPRDTYNGMYS